MSGTPPFGFPYDPKAKSLGSWHIDHKDAHICVLCPRCGAVVDINHFRVRDDGQLASGLRCPGLPDAACSFTVKDAVLLDWATPQKATKRGGKA